MVCFVIVLSGCDKDYCLSPDVPVIEPEAEDIPQEIEARRGQIVSWEYNGTMSRERIHKSFSDLPSDYLKYNLKCYKLVYSTLYREQEVEASALVLIPDSVEKADILAYFHGTALPSDMLVPDFYQFDGSMPRLQLSKAALPMASNGYFVVVPDYVGYGTTYGLEHCFTYYPELFKGNLDAVRATSALAEELGLSTSGQLFLTGWSQGAGAALSAQKYIEQLYKDEFNVAASSSLSGPYDFGGFVDYILSRPNSYYLCISLYCWALYTLNRFSPYMQRPDDQLFRKPVYDQSSVFFSITGTPNDIFRASFIEGYHDGTDRNFLKAIEENSFHKGWIPSGKVFLHHGEADDIVPYLNSTSAYEGLRDCGDVKLYSYPKKGHLTLFKEYVSTTLDDFAPLKCSEE